MRVITGISSNPIPDVVTYDDVIPLLIKVQLPQRSVVLPISTAGGTCQFESSWLDPGFDWIKGPDSPSLFKTAGVEEISGVDLYTSGLMSLYTYDIGMRVVSAHYMLGLEALLPAQN